MKPLQNQGSGILLVTEEAAIEIAGRRWTRPLAAKHFTVSPDIIQFRLNATGALKKVQRSNRRTFR